MNARKSKEQIKKQLNESIIINEQHENKELQDKVENSEKSDEAAEKIREFDIISTL